MRRRRRRAEGRRFGPTAARLLILFIAHDRLVESFDPLAESSVEWARQQRHQPAGDALWRELQRTDLGLALSAEVFDPSRAPELIAENALELKNREALWAQLRAYPHRDQLKRALKKHPRKREIMTQLEKSESGRALLRRLRRELD